MDFSIKPLKNDDREQIIDIFNYYIENSFAAYPDRKVPYQAFDMFMQMSEGYPRGAFKDQNSTIVGFGLLRLYNAMPVFSETAEVTYFIHPDYTGNGLGKKLLMFLEKQGREKGITNLLASISSLNPGSIKFHKNNGFTECGIFKNIGKKHRKSFDVIWMQKKL